MEWRREVWRGGGGGGGGGRSDHHRTNSGCLTIIHDFNSINSKVSVGSKGGERDVDATIPTVIAESLCPTVLQEAVHGEPTPELPAAGGPVEVAVEGVDLGKTSGWPQRAAEQGLTIEVEGGALWLGGRGETGVGREPQQLLEVDGGGGREGRGGQQGNGIRDGREGEFHMQEILNNNNSYAKAM